jgi:hypothetical protein
MCMYMHTYTQFSRIVDFLRLHFIYLDYSYYVSFHLMTEEQPASETSCMFF